MSSPWDYRWDFAFVFPIIQEHLITKQFPQIVSLTAIHDSIENHPDIKKYCILKLEQCISYGLRELGYRKQSVAGKRYEKINLGVIVPISPIPI